MSEIVERVARAIFDSQQMPGDDRKFDAAYPWTQSSCRLAARAAIMAMRVPTDAMVRAQYYADIGEKGSQLSAEDQTGVWQAMVDEAIR